MNLPYEPALGGANKGNRIMAELLAASGHDVVAVVPHRGYPPALSSPELIRSLNERQIQVQSNGDVHRYGLNGVHVHAIDNHGLVRSHLIDQIRSFNPDAVLVSSEEPSQSLLEAAIRISTTKVIYILFTPNFLPFGPMSFYPGQKRAELLRRTSVVVGTSKFVCKYARLWGGLQPVLYYPPVYGRPPFPRLGRFREGFVTMINPCRYKGIDIFVELARQLPCLSFAAVPGWGTTTEDRKRLTLLPNVTLLTPSAQIDDVLVKTSVLVVPSLWLENHPLIITEALLRGVPVVASDCGGIAEAKLGTRFLIQVNPIERFSDELDENHLRVPIIPDQDIAPWCAAINELFESSPVYERESESSQRAAVGFVQDLNIRGLETIIENN